MEIAGAPEGFPTLRGMSYYDFDADGKISFVRDATESAVKPPPLQALAAHLRPALRVFSPRRKSPGGGYGDEGGVEMPAGTVVDPETATLGGRHHFAFRPCRPSHVGGGQQRRTTLGFGGFQGFDWGSI